MSSKKIKITFKKHKKPTGLAGIGAGFFIDAKIKGQRFAILSGCSAFRRDVCIQVAIKSECSKGWDWVFIKNNCKDETESEIFLQSIIQKLSQEFDLYFFEDEK